MKEGWEYKKLGEVIEHLRTGLNPRTHFKLNTPDAEGYYVTVRELKGFAIEPDEKTDKVNKSAIKRINERSNLKIGDVLFSGTGTIGKTALVTELPENWNIKEGVYAMTPKHSELDSKYFIYYIGSDLFLRLVNDKAAGTGVRSIPMKELVKLPISVPPLSEQQSIVDYLDSAFAKIDAMKANAEKSLDEAKALFQASLKKMLETKDGWEEKELQDICQIKGGKRLPKGYVLSSEPKPHRYITVADFTKNGTVVPSTVKYISDEVYKTIKRYTITSNDVYVTIVGSTVGKAGIIPPELDGANLTENACKLVLNNDYDKRFVYYLMCSEYVIKQEQLLTKVSAQPKLALNRLASIIVYVPSLSEQHSIATSLDSLKSKVDRLQENYDKISQECDALKQAILRQVFE